MEESKMTNVYLPENTEPRSLSRENLPSQSPPSSSLLNKNRNDSFGLLGMSPKKPAPTSMFVNRESDKPASNLSSILQKPTNQ